MAVTIWHRVINKTNNNHIRIVNKGRKPERRAVKVHGDVKATRHTISEVKNYD